MSNRDNIEDLFNDAFSNWEPAVPNEVKIAIDEEINQQKRGYFSRFKILIIALFLAVSSAAAWFFTGQNDGQDQIETVADVKRNDNNNGQSASSNAGQPNDNSSSTINSEGDSSVSTNQNSIQTIQPKKSDWDHDVNVNTNNRSRLQSNQGKIKNPLQAKNSGSPKIRIGRNAKTGSLSQTNKNKSAHKSTMADGLTNKSDNQINTAQYKETDETNSATAGQLQNPNPKEITNSSNSTNPEIGQKAESQTIKESIKHEASSENPNPNPGGNEYKKAFFIGAQGGLHKGVNLLSENTLNFSEKLNFAFGLDLAWQFKENQMLSSGLLYQTRKESIEEFSFSVDSTYLYTDTLLQTIIDPNTQDSMTIIVGYTDVYDYDTTSTTQISNALIRMAMIPLSYDFRVYHKNNHAFWLRSGVNLGLYQSRVTDSFGQMLTQNQFAMQIQVRPTYLYSIGKFQAGIYGNFAYDAILPQTWSLSRRRFQGGFGLQLLYNLSK